MYSLILLSYMMLVPDGTLLFVEGGNEIVMSHTDSPYSHVALIFNEDGKPYVYEANRPACRRISLDDYVKEVERLNAQQGKAMKLWLCHPKNLAKSDVESMKQYCEEQIGRKYKIKSYISGKPEKTIHCGEMTARALIAGGMDIKQNPYNKKRPRFFLGLFLFLCVIYTFNGNKLLSTLRISYLSIFS